MWAEHTADHAHAAEMSRRERREGADPDRVDERNVRDTSTTEQDLAVEVARAHEATERILAQGEAEREAAERAAREPVRTEPDRGYERER